jgi:hypothetical protein
MLQRHQQNCNLLIVGNRCIPTEFDDIVSQIIDKAEFINALKNIQLIGSINGVSWLKNAVD